jgi:hypothetical protein
VQGCSTCVVPPATGSRSLLAPGTGVLGAPISWRFDVQIVAGDATEPRRAAAGSPDVLRCGSATVAVVLQYAEPAARCARKRPTRIASKPRRPHGLTASAVRRCRPVWHPLAYRDPGEGVTACTLAQRGRPWSTLGPVARFGCHSKASTGKPAAGDRRFYSGQAGVPRTEDALLTGSGSLARPVMAGPFGNSDESKDSIAEHASGTRCRQMASTSPGING